MSSARIEESLMSIQSASNGNSRDRAYAFTALAFSEYLEFHSLLKDVRFYRSYRETGATPLFPISLAHAMYVLPYAIMYVPMVFMLGPAINRYVMLRALNRHIGKLVAK